ncbi:hypothetical protein [Vibrio gigantis]|uniref:Uncharacterized protein n=1 Tax=Vibrio gigantis TaxID=296199 RepID=A0A5M9NPB0_9VIBR|nr:hypothetical protein [Vibrio gigantis]KAA8672289.1 hypothetical protein F4W18_15105 [Vibrio gigantis]
MSKIGEQIVQRCFSEKLKHQLDKRYGKYYHYASGELNGGLDRLYADYFASVGTKCVLIEFKEFETEIRREKEKPLRKKLCEEIPLSHQQNSYDGHFISWRDKDCDSINVNLDRYISKVGPLFGKTFDGFAQMDAEDFIEDFIDGFIGIEFVDFECYLRYLASLDDGSGGSGGGFGGMILVFNKKLKKFVTAIFHNINDIVAFNEKHGLTFG